MRLARTSTPLFVLPLLGLFSLSACAFEEAGGATPAPDAPSAADRSGAGPARLDTPGVDTPMSAQAGKGGSIESPPGVLGATSDAGVVGASEDAAASSFPDASDSVDAASSGTDADASEATIDASPMPSRQFCQDQAILGGVGYQVQCANGACRCRAGGVLEWTCVDDGRACRIARRAGAVTGACCAFSDRTITPDGARGDAGVPGDASAGGQCQAQTRVGGQRFAVECSNGHCVCKRGRSVVGTCEADDNACDIVNDAGGVRVGCCAFSL